MLTYRYIKGVKNSTSIKPKNEMLNFSFLNKKFLNWNPNTKILYIKIIEKSIPLLEKNYNL